MSSGEIAILTVILPSTINSRTLIFERINNTLIKLQFFRPVINLKNTKQDKSNDKELVGRDQEFYSPSINENFLWSMVRFTHLAISACFMSLGLYKRGYKNILDIKLNENTLYFPNLPEEFSGLRILFMSDLHLGKVKEVSQIIQEKVDEIDVDICLLGGDYRYSFAHPHLPFLDEMADIVAKVRAPMGIYGVLGNHDDPEFIPAFEKLGIKMLINESICLSKGDHSIFLTGVDEPFYFKRDDVSLAFSKIPPKAFNICLIHTPDAYLEASRKEASLYICGHTHHGQIQLPWIGPIITQSRAPRAFSTGLWKHNGMIGLTGAGVGTGAPPIRFRCPPEIIVLTLKTEE